MSIENNKLMNLADGKILYDDLRERVDQKYKKPANGIPASDIEEGVIPDISSKADKADTVLDTTLSRGRKENTTIGTGSIAFGKDAEASGSYSYAQGYETTASANYAHAEGYRTTASGVRSHAEGDRTTASGEYAHAEGAASQAQGITSHAEGGGTVASGTESHAEGGHTTASGKDSHAEGAYTVANHLSQHVFGQYNIPDPSQEPANNKGTYVEIVGNGENANNTSNARALDWNGNERLHGDLYVGCNDDSSGGTKVANVTELQDMYKKIELMESYIPDTVQTITFDQQTGNISQILHSRNNVAVRTDVFTFGSNSVTEVRTLDTGESLTIDTNTATLVTTVAYTTV